MPLGQLWKKQTIRQEDLCKQEEERAESEIAKFDFVMQLKALICGHLIVSQYLEHYFS